MDDIRIIPACAGSSFVKLALKHVIKDHPRMRGEQVW